MHSMRRRPPGRKAASAEPLPASIALQPYAPAPPLHGQDKEDRAVVAGARYDWPGLAATVGPMQGTGAWTLARRNARLESARRAHGAVELPLCPGCHLLSRNP